MSDDVMTCDLCRAKMPIGWRHVCDKCFQLWELGRQKTKLEKAEGKLGHAQVILKLKTDGRDGDPKGECDIKSADLIAAMGAVKLKGTSIGGKWSSPEGSTHIGISNRNNWMMGGSEHVQVPQGRAKAMKKIVSAILNALSKARTDGFNEGRNLLAGLAKGRITVDDFSEASERVRKGEIPNRW